MARLETPEALEAFRQEILTRRDPDSPCVSICAGAGCVASGADEVIAAFEKEIETKGLSATVSTKGTGCPGFCEQGPVVVIYPEEICYLQVQAKDVPEIVEQTIENNQVVERLCYKDPATGDRAVKESDIPFTVPSSARSCVTISKSIRKALKTTWPWGDILPWPRPWVR